MTNEKYWKMLKPEQDRDEFGIIQKSSTVSRLEIYILPQVKEEQLIMFSLGLLII